MDYKLHTIDGIEIAELTGDTIIDNGSTFLQVVMNVPVDNIIIHKKQLPESFFELRSGIAGDILQKVANHKLRCVIVGDFQQYDSKALRDFIYESNKSKTVNFLSTMDDALGRLSQ